MILMIAMPTLGEVATPTVKSLIALTQSLRERRIPFGFETHEFSDIVLSRNQLMSIFLTRERYTHLLFLDSDMSFKPEAISRLIDFGVDFAATAYPQKYPRWNRLRRLIEREAGLPEDRRTPIETLLHQVWIYNHQRAEFGGAAWVPRRRDGFITVPATGTGMMLMSRAVPETMVARGAALAKPRMSEVPLHKGIRFHDFFSHLDSPEGDVMYGEDQSFCMRWTRDCGGDIWLDTRSEVIHYGVKPFPGVYADRLEVDFPNIDDSA